MRYEEADPPRDFVEAVARALDVDLNWLLTGDGVAPLAIEGLQPPVIESGDLPKEQLEPSRSPAQGTPNDDLRAALVDRIGRAIELAGGGRDLAERIGISPRGLGEIAAGARDPTPEQLARLARAAGVSAGWLLTGEGDAEISSLPVWAAQPQGGEGTVLEDWIVDWIKISTQVVRALGPPDKIGAMYLRGDSMAPTYVHGQLLFVEQDPTARDEVCLVRVGNTLKIKRVRYTPDGRVQLISDNKNYPPEEYSADDARVLGRVVGLKER